MPDDGAGWVGTSWYYPYRSMYANLAWLPWLEVNLRLTEFETGPLISPGYGRYKDKALDLKLLLQKQKNFIPSLAGGALDVVGTEIMKSWYGVATWRFDNWAFSAGYGTDRLNGFFGGVQYDVSPWLEFKAEYSPLDYTRDKTSNVYIHPDPADQKYNLGFVAKTDWGGDFSLSYQRGEELSFGFSYAFDCNNPPFFKFGNKSSKEKELPVPGKPGVPDWDNTDPEKLAADIFQGLEECVKVRDVEILMGDRTLLVAYENIGYASDAEALARVFAVVANVAPWDMDTLSLVPRLRGVPVVRADFPGSQAALLRMGRISRYDAPEARIAWAPSGTSLGERPEESWRLQSHAALRKRGQSSFKIMVVYEPRIDRTLEEDYMNRWSLDAIYQWRSSRGWEAIFDVRLPLENTIDIYWEPETNDDVRIWKGVYSYLKELENLPLGEKSFLLAEAGWVDENWF
ncbi:MAG TPA: YjbH domain-containing protein, partial [Synergistaceae bacterium]|nr:YjbH domain-containing protein [Synergistaceae bacterium]